MSVAPALPPGPKRRVDMVRVLRENWKEELVVARVYRALAEAEPNPKRRDLLTRMAVSEEEHAALWAERLAMLGVTVDPAEAESDFQKQNRLLRLFGPDAMIRRIEREERGHVADYQAQIKALGDPESTAILERVIPDEKAHAERLQRMAAESEGGPRSRLESLLSREKWHAHGTGSWIGDAIYGINDGLGAVFGIVSAVAGASGASPKFVLVAGLAGMIGSAFSMGSSAYLAAKSEREVHEAEIERERREIETDPEHEREELELMYQIKGFTEEEAKAMAERLTRSPEEFLRTMVGEELGLSEERLPNPWMSALVAMLSTALGAFLPIIPFFYASGMNAVLQSLVISIVAHFAVGASKTFITGRSWVAQGLEMTFVGLLGGALAYGFGLLLGAHGSL
jgi:VIT1/CCC1 family predicted Fe2+/Mn2+ transporter/rubrerythrin